ncbi:MFS transporter [Catellatospora sp. TT07R-123]|uniref:MFS transporter n=1 Tax=Catellatospora sp. TT07R-123 TaxID=2733863 RepID=UPI001B0851C9|nr:MFS transporter [Catellatospora sp. TT07R-123]GHJ42837.1 MFS transporter [Catellatospora sp. TT07R-123]
MSTRTTAPVRMSLLLLAYFAFISLGLPDGLLGVAWPSMSADLHVSRETIGLLLIPATCGYLVSTVTAGFVLARLGVGRLLAGSTALASAALFGYGLSPAIAVTMTAALAAGLAGGAIDAGLNAYAASAFGPRHMNWLHAFFGLGVAMGPLIMTASIQYADAWRPGYLLVASGQAALALAFALTARQWAQRPAYAQQPHEAHAGPVRARDTLALPAVWFSVLTIAVYVALEVAAGLFAYQLLTEGRGMGDAVAGVCVSLYWGSLFAGRVLQGFAAHRFLPGRVVIWSIGGMAAGAVLVAIPGPGWLAAFGFMVIGFAAAAVFPMFTLLTAERVGAAHADRTIGLQMAGAGLGGSVIPAAIGVVMGAAGVEALGPSLVVLAAALVAAYLAATGGARRRA